MAQQWWALDELGDLGELDALLSSATAACDAGVVGDAAPMCARATTSGAPLTPSEAAPDACAQPACGDETSAPGPAVSGDTGGETEAPCYSHQTQDAQPQRSGEGGGHTRRLRCLDERHPPTCARCVAPPDAATLHLFKLTGDPQKKNGEKKLRSLLTRTAEWQDAAAREKLAAELEASAMSGKVADAPGTAQLARALVERDCAGLRKQSMVLLARVWGYRADIWQRLPSNAPGGGGAKASSSDGDGAGSKRKRERRSQAQQRSAAALAAAAAAEDDDEWQAGLARAAGLATSHCHVTRRAGVGAGGHTTPYGGMAGAPACVLGRPATSALVAHPPPSADVAELRQLVRCALAPLARDAARAWAGEGARHALAGASPAAAQALCAARLGDNAALLRVARKAAAWAGAQHALLRGWRQQLAAGAPDSRAAAAWARLRGGEGPADAVLRALAQLLLAGGADSRAARARDAAAEADRLFPEGVSPETASGVVPPMDAAAGAALLTWQAELDGGVADALRWVQGAQRASAALRAPHAGASFSDYLEASDVLCELAFAFLTAVAAAFAHRRAWMLQVAGVDESAPVPPPQRCERLLRLVQQPPAAAQDAAAEEEARAAAWAATAAAATQHMVVASVPPLPPVDEGTAWPELAPPPQGRWVVA